MESETHRFVIHQRKIRRTHEGSIVVTERWYNPDTHMMLESIVLSSEKVPNNRKDTKQCVDLSSV